MSSSESEEVGIKNDDLFVKQKAEQTKKAKRTRKLTTSPKLQKIGRKKKSIHLLNCLRTSLACGISTIRTTRNAT